LSSVNLIVNIALLVIAGGLVNGPYALITTAVSAELGTHSSLKGNSKALSTVTSIIDGTGSIGIHLNIFSFYMFNSGCVLIINLFLFKIRSSRWTSSGCLHIQHVWLDKCFLYAYGFQCTCNIGKFISLF